MEKNPAVTSFCFLNNTQALAYFSIFNRIEPQQHLISEFLMEENLSHNLFLPIEPYKTIAVPYLS